jgi:hypothetical protein
MQDSALKTAQKTYGKGWHLLPSAMQKALIDQQRLNWVRAEVRSALNRNSTIDPSFLREPIDHE